MNRVALVLDALGAYTEFIRAQVDHFTTKIADGHFPVTAYSSLVEALAENKSLHAGIVGAVINHLSTVEDMDIEEMDSTASLIKILREFVPEEQIGPVLAAVQNNAESYAESIETSEIDSPDTLRDDVRSMARIGTALGIDLSRQQDAIEAKAKDVEERAGESSSDGDEDYGSGRYTALPRDFSDRDADALFRTLKQP